MIFWICLAVLLLFLLGGWLLMEAVCGRRPVTPETEARRPHVQQARAWLQTQNVREVHVESYDGKLLCGQLVLCDNARGTLLLFHGYHANALLDYAPTMAYYHSLGLNLLLVDQRAHGRSQGRFLTFGLKERMDVLSWVTYVSLLLGENHPQVLLGMSMGAATVCMAAGSALPGNVRGVIADCGYNRPWDEVRSVIARDHPRLAGFLTGLFGVFTHLYGGFGLRDWSSAEGLAGSKLPVLLLHGEDDHFVPCAMSREIYAACTGEKRLVTFPGADHCRSFETDPAAYQQAVEAFLNDHLKERETP